jgi:hypothetical protein
MMGPAGPVVHDLQIVALTDAGKPGIDAAR